MIGRRFGHLIVLKQVGKNFAGRRMFLCRCDCGSERDVVGKYLRNGDTRSCGCVTRTLISESSIVHGHSRRGARTGEYRIWSLMLRRTRATSGHEFFYYRSRGITVCERWQKFENFLADMGPRPTPSHSIDRINNDGNYEPGNCRWATLSQQNRNTRMLARNTSGLRGVSWSKAAGKWRAQIKVNGNVRHLGTFGDAQSAAEAYRFAVAEVAAAEAGIPTDLTTDERRTR